MVSRLADLAYRLTARTGGIRGAVTFTEATGEVCDATGRSTARLDRAGAVAFRLGHRR